MSDLQMKAWHIENLIEAEPDCQVVLYDDAKELIEQQQREIDALLAHVEYLKGELKYPIEFDDYLANFTCKYANDKYPTEVDRNE